MKWNSLHGVMQGKRKTKSSFAIQYNYCLLPVRVDQEKWDSRLYFIAEKSGFTFPTAVQAARFYDQQIRIYQYVSSTVDKTRKLTGISS